MKHAEYFNKRARHDYTLLEEFEAGMSLTTPLVKGIHKNGINLNGSHVVLRDTSAVLIGASVSYPGVAPLESIPLLLHKRELNRLIGKINEKGLAVVPVKCFCNRRGKYKVIIAVAKGNTEFDKRENDKAKSIDLELRRVVKSQKFE